MGPVLIRELSQRERQGLEFAKTGDLLPDGSILLRRRDMDHMGLAQLNLWIKSALEKGSTVAIYEETSELHALALDDRAPASTRDTGIAMIARRFRPH